MAYLCGVEGPSVVAYMCGVEGASGIAYVLRPAAMVVYGDRLRVGWLNGVPREQKMLKGHLPKVIYITKFTSIRRSRV